MIKALADHALALSPRTNELAVSASVTYLSPLAMWPIKQNDEAY